MDSTSMDDSESVYSSDNESVRTNDTYRNPVRSVDENDDENHRSSFSTTLFRRKKKGKNGGNRKNRASVSRMMGIVSPVSNAFRKVLLLDTQKGQKKRSKNVLAKGHKERIQRKKSRAEPQSPQHARSHRAQTLKREWFEKRFKDDDVPLSDILADLNATIEIEEQMDENKSNPDERREHRDTEVSEFAIGITALPDGVNEEEYIEKTDLLLREHFKSINDGTADKQLIKRTRQRIKEIRDGLLLEQNNYVSEVRKKSAALVKSLEKQVKLLTSTLKAKMQEYSKAEMEQFSLLDKVRNHGDPNVSNQSGAGEILKKMFWLGESEPKKKNMDGKEIHFAKKYELLREIRRLTEEIEVLINEKYTVEVEKHFPKRMQWKLRLNAGGGSAIGMQDLDFDNIESDITIRMGEEQGVISVHIKEITAKIGISNLSVKGSSLSSQMTKMFVTPTMNRLDLGLRGEWTLVLRYEPAVESNNFQGKWVEDKQRSTLANLKLNREMSGLSALRLPSKIIEYIATSLIPSAINESVKNSFPPSLGSSLLDKPHNKIVIQGKIAIKQDINSLVWRAPLVGTLESSAQARKSLGLTDYEAIRLESLLRGKLATEAGYHKKAASLYRLHKWRLQYAAHPISKLKDILNLVQFDAMTGNNEPSRNDRSSTITTQTESHEGDPLVPEDWLFHILDTVEDLANKSVQCRIELTNINLELDMNNVVRFFADTALVRLEDQTMKAVSADARRVAETRKLDTERRIKEASSWFDNTVLPKLSSEYKTKIDSYIHGGLQDGSVALNFEKFSGGLLLDTFNFNTLLGWSPSKLSGYNLNIKGDQVDGNSNETAYQVRLKHKWMNKEDGLYDMDHQEEDGHVVLKNVDLKLFPKGEPSGTIALQGDAVESWVSMAALSEFLAYWFVYPEEELQQRHEQILLEQRSLKPKSSVRSVFAEVDGDPEPDFPLHISDEIEIGRQSVAKVRNNLRAARALISDDIRDDIAAEKEKKIAKKLRKKRHSVGRKKILSPNKDAVAAVATGNVETIRKDQHAHPYLPRLMLDHHHDFFLFIRHLVVKAEKVETEIDEDSPGDLENIRSDRFIQTGKQESIILTMNRASKYANSNSFAVYEMNWTLADMLDDVES